MNKGSAELMKILGMMSDDNNVWVTDFDSESTARFYSKFMELERNDQIHMIPVFVNSYGGDVYALTAMRDLIKSSRKPVATIGVGMAMSCGASLLASGTKGFRFAAKDMHILIHQVSSLSLGKMSDIQESARVTKDLNKKMFDNLAADCGRKPGEFEKEIKKRLNVDWTLSAASAKRWGLVDQIGIPRVMGQSSADVLATTLSFEEISKREGLVKSKR